MSLSKHLSNAQKFHQENKLEEALYHYNEVVTLDENHIDGLYGLGRIYLDRGEVSKSKSNFEKAHLLAPTDLDIAYHYLLCLTELNKNKEALQTLKKVASLIPDDIELAIIFVKVAKKLGAIQEITLILEQQAQLTPQLEVLLSQCYMKLEQWKKAYPLLIGLTQANPKVMSLLNALVITAREVGKFKQAILAYKAIIELEPTAENYLGFTELYLQAEDAIEAKAMFEKSTQSEVKSEQSLRLKCILARLNNNIEELSEAAESLLIINPTNSIAWQELQELTDKESSLNFALRLKKAMNPEHEKHNPSEFSQNCYTLAKAYEKHHEFIKAFEHFSMANVIQNSILKQKNKAYQPSENEKIYKALTSYPYREYKNTESKVEHIFIVGMPRSGTTLINRLFSQHPDTESCNESQAISDYFESSLLSLNANPHKVNSVLSQQANYQKHYRSYIGIDKKITIDKMPHNFRFVGAILTAFPNAKIIQMRRDPSDIALSIYSQNFNDGHPYACHLPDIAHAIWQANELMDYWRVHFPESVIDVKYEDLSSHPTSTSQKIFDFCNLEWKEEFLNFHQEVVSSFTFSELQVRKPINTKKIGFSNNYSEQLLPFTNAYKELLKL